MKVGDKIRIKEWDEMVQEYGFDTYEPDCIDVAGSMYFSPGMRPFCGTVQTIGTVCHCGCGGVTLESDDSLRKWSFTPAMFTIIDEDPEEVLP